MPVAEALLVLAFVVLVLGAVSTVAVGLGYLASALANRLKMPRWFAVAVSVCVSLTVGVVCLVSVIIAFGAVANADAAAKATMLAKGISEAMNCTAFIAVAVAVAAVPVATMFWFARRWNRRPPGKNESG